MEYGKNDFLVIKASHGNYYGFNLKVKMERAYVTKIVSPNESDNFRYIGTVLTKIKKPTIDIDHSSSYYDINIRKYEFGKELAEVAAVMAMKKETLVVVVLCSRYTAFFEQSIPFCNNMSYSTYKGIQYWENTYSLGISTAYIHT